MVRKLLIAFALIIAIAPYIGFSHAFVQGISVSLGLVIAAILLFSRRPRTTQVPPPTQEPEVRPTAPIVDTVVHQPTTPVIRPERTQRVVHPMIAPSSMQPLTVGHDERKEEHSVAVRPDSAQGVLAPEEKVIVGAIATPQEASSVIDLPRPKRRSPRPSPLAALKEEANTKNVESQGASLTPSEASELHAFEVSRRPRRQPRNTILSEEEQVHPADKPFPVRQEHKGGRIDHHQ